MSNSSTHTIIYKYHCVGCTVCPRHDQTVLMASNKSLNSPHCPPFTARQRGIWVEEVFGMEYHPHRFDLLNCCPQPEDSGISPLNLGTTTALAQCWTNPTLRSATAPPSVRHPPRWTPHGRVPCCHPSTLRSASARPAIFAQSSSLCFSEVSHCPKTELPTKHPVLTWYWCHCSSFRSWGLSRRSNCRRSSMPAIDSKGRCCCQENNNLVPRAWVLWRVQSGVKKVVVLLVEWYHQWNWAGNHRVHPKCRCPECFGFVALAVAPMLCRWTWCRLATKAGRTRVPRVCTAPKVETAPTFPGLVKGEQPRCWTSCWRSSWPESDRINVPETGGGKGRGHSVTAGGCCVAKGNGRGKEHQCGNNTHLYCLKTMYSFGNTCVSIDWWERCTF